MLIDAFRIFPKECRMQPRDNKLYFKVRIFRTEKQLHDFVIDLQKKHGLKCKKIKRFTAFTCKYLDPEFPDQFGEILFHRKSLKISVISHELTHAAIDWFKYRFYAKDWKNIQSSKIENETFAYLQGGLMEQFLEQINYMRADPKVKWLNKKL